MVRASRSIIVAAAILIPACGGRVVPDPNALSDDFAVVGTRCFGENGKVMRDACLLPALPNFAPNWVPPAPRRQACNDVQLDAFEQACLESSPTSESCVSFQQLPSNADCAKCILTPDTAPAYGPVVWHESEQRFEVNDGGCIAAVLGDSSADGCGARVQALVECIIAACAECHVAACTGPGCNNPLACECTTAAEGGACKSYVEAASCATPIFQAGNSPAGGCVGLPGVTSPGSQSDYRGVARTVCGGAP